MSWGHAWPAPWDAWIEETPQREAEAGLETAADGWVSSQAQACSPLPASDSTDENWISSGHIRGGTPVFMFMYLDSRQL